MIYLYDKAIEKKLNSFFNGVVKIIDESNTYLKFKDREDIALPLITIMREDMSIDEEVNSQAFKTGIKLFRDIENVTLKVTKIYPITLTYKIKVYADNLDILDDVFGDLIYVLRDRPKVYLDSIFKSESKLDTEDNKVYTELVIENSSLNTPEEFETGIRYSAEINVKTNGAKMYYSVDRKPVLTIPLQTEFLK